MREEDEEWEGRKEEEVGEEGRGGRKVEDVKEGRGERGSGEKEVEKRKRRNYQLEQSLERQIFNLHRIHADPLLRLGSLSK